MSSQAQLQSQAQPDLLQLADIISAKARDVDRFLRKEGLPFPSFGVDAPSPDYLPAGDAAAEVRRSRTELAAAARTLFDLAVGPHTNVFNACFLQLHDAHVIRTIVEFGIAQAVPREGSISYAQLASKVGLEEEILRRCLGYAFLIRWFCEPVPGFVAHTAASILLVSDQSALDFCGLMSDTILPGVSHQTTANKRWHSTSNVQGNADGDANCDVKTPQLPNAAKCGAQIHRGMNGGLRADWAKEPPELIRRFLGAMDFSARSPLAPPRLLEDIFDWRSLGSGTVVDVGGSGGHKAATIASIAPELRLVVQDRAEVVAGTQQRMIPAVRDLVEQGRLNFQAQDFFEPQPADDSNGNVVAYFLGCVLHDWDDDNSVEIVRNLLPSMKPGSRLIINDFVVPAPGSVPWPEERLVRGMDMQMLVAVNARERTLDQFKALVQKASNGQLTYEKHGMLSVVFIRAEQDA